MTFLLFLANGVSTDGTVGKMDKLLNKIRNKARNIVRGTNKLKVSLTSRGGFMNKQMNEW